MKRMLSYSLVLMLVVASVKCNLLSGDDEREASDLGLSGVVWQLESFEDKDGRKEDIGTEDFMIVFMEDSFIGQAFQIEDPRGAGNSYWGPYEINSAGEITIRVSSTLKGDILGSKFEEYVRAVSAAFRYEIKGTRLRIYYDAGKVLNYKPCSRTDVCGQYETASL